MCVCGGVEEIKDAGDHMDCDFLAAQQEVLMDLSSAALICHVLMTKAGSTSSSNVRTCLAASQAANT